MRKSIAVAAVAALAGALTFTAISGAQTGPGHTQLGVSPVTTPGPGVPTAYDQPPGIRLVKRVTNKARFTLKRSVRVGTAVCGTGTCSVSTKSAFAAVRRKAHFGANVIVAGPTMQAGEIRPIRVKLSKKAFRKVKNGTKNGLGHAKFRLTLVSTPGYSISAVGNARYKSKKRKK